MQALKRRSNSDYDSYLSLWISKLLLAISYALATYVHSLITVAITYIYT